MNSTELASLKKQMVIKLGTTTNDEAEVISNMVDGASAGALPAVTADDNGKALMVSSGAWGAGNIPAELPAVTADDNGKVLMVVDGAWAIASLPAESK